MHVIPYIKYDVEYIVDNMDASIFHLRKIK
jgi:hypothetical protein